MVRSGGYRCGIPVIAAKQVVTAPRLVPMPGSGTRLLGLAQIGGEPVAVVDLHALLDQDEAPGGSHKMIVVVRGADGAAAVGLAVDEAFGVATVAGVPERGEDDPWVVAGRVDRRGRPIYILDPERLAAERHRTEKGAPHAG